MAADQNSAAGKQTYIAPSLARMPIGATAASNAQNSDVTPFVANTAVPPPGGS